MVVVGFPWPAHKPRHHLETQKTTALLLRFEATQTAAFYNICGIIRPRVKK